MVKNRAVLVSSLVFCLLTGSTPSRASTISFVGDLRADASVISCGPSCTLGPADSDGDYAQYAAVVESFSVATTSTVTAVSFSYGGGVNGAGMTIAEGGLEPYLSLFDATGSFLASTFPDASLCPAGAHTNTGSGQCYDVLLDGGVLSPGAYRIALTAYENMSFAENLGTGTLADGFTGLGNLNGGEDLHYAFDVTLSPSLPTVTPEPLPLGLIGLSGVVGAAANLVRRFASKAHSKSA